VEGNLELKSNLEHLLATTIVNMDTLQSWFSAKSPPVSLDFQKEDELDKIFFYNLALIDCKPVSLAHIVFVNLN
jgi:hypothetical protein